METPRNKNGDMTELIMAIFWSKQPVIPGITTEQYNRIYSHVLDVLNTHATWPPTLQQLAPAQRGAV